MRERTNTHRSSPSFSPHPMLLNTGIPLAGTLVPIVTTKAILALRPAIRLAASVDADWLVGSKGLGSSRGYMTDWLPSLYRKRPKSDRQSRLVFDQGGEMGNI